MSRLLYVIANPRPMESSVTRQLGEFFLERRRLLRAGEMIETLDLSIEDVPYLDAVTADVLTNPARGGLDESARAALPPSWALAASDRYTAQFIRSDRIVLASPLWNFGPPAILKAWIDLIVRQGQTFEFAGEGVRPLVHGKRMLVIGARGGVYSGDSPLREFEMLEPYLRRLFGFLGVETMECVWAEGTTYPESAAARASLDLARGRLAELAAIF